MAGKPAHHRPTTAADIRLLLARGMTKAQAAEHLGMSRSTLYRILEASSYRGRGGRR